MRDRVLDIATIAAATCAIIITATAVWDRFGPTPEPAVALQSSGNVLVSDWPDLLVGAHRIGAADAVLTVVEFGDFECPACARFAQAFREFRARHPADVALVYRHWPMDYHRFAYPAARAAECAAAQGRFPSFHDLLFVRQDSLGLLSFHEIARRGLVLDLQRFDECNLDQVPVAAIERDRSMARAIGGKGTPTLIANGRLLSSIPDVAGLEALLKRARSRDSLIVEATESAKNLQLSIR